MNGQADTTIAGAPTTGPLEGATVLAVDARAAAGTALMVALRADGCSLLLTPDGATALTALARQRPDAAIVHAGVLDERVGLVRQLRSAAPALPIIVYGPLSDAPRAALQSLDAGVAVVAGDAPEHLRAPLACTLAVLHCVERLRHDHELRSLMLVQLCQTLRAPLDVIQGYAELLRSTDDAGDAQLAHEGLACAVANAMRLTREHLAVASLDAPGLEVRCEPVELDALIDDLRRGAARPLAGRSVHLAASTPFRGALLYTDGDKLHALLAQLLARAAACAPHGALRLRVRVATDGTRFELLDRTDARAAAPTTRLGDLPAAATTDLALVQRLTQSLGARLDMHRGRTGGAFFALHIPAALTVPPAEAGRRTLH